MARAPAYPDHAVCPLSITEAPRTVRPILVFAVLWVLFMGLQPQHGMAQEIYRWVDDSGRVHISDTVPEQYKSSAKRYDARQFERTEEQKRRAEVNSQRVANVLRSAPARPTLANPDAMDPATAGLPQDAPVLDPETADCDALHQQFKQAQECFTPFRTRDGIRGGEAFQKCQDIPSPPARCGLQKIYR